MTPDSLMFNEQIQNSQTPSTCRQEWDMFKAELAALINNQISLISRMSRSDYRAIVNGLQLASL